jgi:MFS family permease
LFLMIFSSIMLPMFPAAVDGTIVATALPAITGALGDVPRVSWILVASLVGNTIAALVFGQLDGGVRCRKKMAPTLGFFAGGSLLRALSTSILMLTGSRLLQGAARQAAHRLRSGRRS